jgi:hypothetical protein
MRLGEILLKRELVTDAAISEALERQKTSGGRLGANLIALGYLTEEQLSSVIHGAPAAPNGLSATGISGRNLLSLLLKFMSVEGCETVLDLANRIKLPRLVVQQLFDEATQQKRKNSCRPWALRAALACPFDTPHRESPPIRSGSRPATDLDSVVETAPRLCNAASGHLALRNGDVYRASASYVFHPNSTPQQFDAVC